jgi:hypothetical protein
VSSSNDIASAFVFVYTILGEYKGKCPTLDQRTFYDSYTKELVVADVSLPPDPTKIINLSDSDENKLKQTMRDNNLFRQRRSITRMLLMFMNKDCMLYLMVKSIVCIGMY